MEEGTSTLMAQCKLEWVAPSCGQTVIVIVFAAPPEFFFFPELIQEFQQAKMVQMLLS